MSITEALDLAIKMNEMGSIDGAYVTLDEDNKSISRQAYMTNEEWNCFLADMPTEARNEYSAGGGDELSEKGGRPPKMASYGSSSRMIYNLSRNKAGFHFEKKLPTTVGGKANLDGFCDDGGRYIFVEAKCHEPYSTKRSSVSKAYLELYDYINENMSGLLQIDAEPSKCGRYLNVDFYAEGEKLLYFDLKQMICHLLGIATGILKGTLKIKQTDFIYLLYDPTELDIAPEAKEKIDEIYLRTCYECNLVDFAELFRVIIEFLAETELVGVLSSEDIYNIILKFTFTLASQDFYPILIQ